MSPDKAILKRQIDQSRPNELLVLSVNNFKKNSLQMCQKAIDKFIKKQEDYVIVLIKK